MTDKKRLEILNAARAELRRTKEGYNPLGGHWREAEKQLDLLAADLRPKAASWANVGPVVAGQPSLLDYAPTHNSDGIPLYIAFDAAWRAGTPIIAPEACTVFLKDTSASPGEAIYLRGASKLCYWIGHITRDWPLGHVFRKGAVIASVFDQTGTDHGHFGVNGEAYLGVGKQFKYGRTGNGPDYTFGAATYREQLKEAA